MVRRLVLQRETLAELTTADLDGVVAGAPAPPSSDCPDNTYYCPTGHAMCHDLLSRIACP